MIVLKLFMRLYKIKCNTAVKELYLWSRDELIRELHALHQ